MKHNNELSADILKDIEDIGKITIVPNLLNVICQTTGMGFAAVARVTDNKWITCSVKDDILFGLKPGDELQLETTICNEIRVSHEAVVIDHVAKDADFVNHHTPAMYGFQSYISMPIIRKDGSFFGTLCAIDPKPRELKVGGITEMFRLFAELIAFHLQAVEHLGSTISELKNVRTGYQQYEEEQKIFTAALEKQVQQRTIELKNSNEDLHKMNKELQAFAYVSSHDLQEPLRKIRTFASRLRDTELANLTEHGKDYFHRMEQAAGKMQQLISDLLAFSGIAKLERLYETKNIAVVIDEVKEDMKEELLEKNAVIEMGALCEVRMIPFQFRQLIQNIISNSLKFSKDGVAAHITISSSMVNGSHAGVGQLDTDRQYCHLKIADNGIGFEQRYSEQIFHLFQRLHGSSEYPGTGLGLSIVERIVENHQGYITAEGEVAKGATFHIYLPT